LSPSQSVTDSGTLQDNQEVDSDNEAEGEMDEQELGMSLSHYLIPFPLISCAERLKSTWHSSVYGFFKSKVDIGYEGGRKFHYFRCAARRCKGSGGVRRYLDSKDRAATSNLKTHATKCFGSDAVEAAVNGTKSGARDGSIFAAFACPGQQAVSVSHRAHTTEETRY